MDTRERIDKDDKLQGVLGKIAGIFEHADRDAFMAALASNDTVALAKALKVSPEALPDIIKAVCDAAGNLIDLPEVKTAARLLSESD